MKNLSVKSTDNNIDLQPQFDQNTNEYEINIPESLKEITLTAVPYMKNTIQGLHKWKRNKRVAMITQLAQITM